jgi:enoyl-[acyl-carrier-protein] reductase (NADH)
MKNKIKQLDAFMAENLSDFKEMIDKNVNKLDVVIHQDAFAANYQYDEYVLLGKAIKYAGSKGIAVTVMGVNRETLV